MNTLQIDLDGRQGWKVCLIGTARQLAKQLNQDVEDITALLQSVDYREVLRILQARFGKLITFVGSHRKAGIVVKRKRFNDDTPMPWGRYLDCPMRQVPLRYFKWLSIQPWMRYWPAMRDYINFERGVWNGESIYDDVPSTSIKSDKVINSIEQGDSCFEVGLKGITCIQRYDSQRFGTWYLMYYDHGSKHYHLNGNTVTKVNGEKP